MGLALVFIFLGANTEEAYAGLCDSNPVTYKFTFQGNFNEKSSPVSLPDPHVRFTQVIWGTHSSQEKFWSPGAMASPAIESVAEEGATRQLTDEFIAASIRDNMGGLGVFPSGRYPGGQETLSVKITLCEEAPLVTAVSMVDLSPDWFVGISSYSLRDSQGNWIPSRIVDLYPYDAGTEDGTEYSLNNDPSNPYQPITSIKGQGKFSGASAPIARMKFELIRPVNLSVSGHSRGEVGPQQGSISWSEGGTLTITATLANTSGSALSIPIQIGSSETTAQAGDYTVASSISIASNAKSGTTTFRITEDSNDEPTEKVRVKPGSPLPSGMTAGNPVLITIRDNDATVVSLARSDTGAIAENGAGAKKNAEFTVTLGRELVAGERIDVPLVMSGTGITADDLERLSAKSGGNLNKGVTLTGTATLTPTVIFQGAGARTATLILTPKEDNQIESNETLTVALGPDGNGTNGFDRSEMRTNVGGGANPHSSSKSFDVVIESEGTTTVSTTVPVVSISGSSAITEGGTATFSLNATPKPTSSITVKVSVQSGSFAQSGQQSVTIGTAGTGSFTVTTVNDSTDEPDGSITATLTSGTGYSVGSPSSASVAVNDNDGPPVPVVSISGSSAITEGDTATFSLNATPKPASSITVKINVQSGSFAQSGQQSVTIGTAGTGSLTVRTVNDSTDEPNGSITATLVSGTGYSVGSPSSASVTVNDNDNPQVPVVSISGSSAITEGDTATFSLSANPKPASSITVRVNVQSGSFAQSGQRNVVIGTGGTGSFTVTTVNDSTDEPDGSVTATLVSGTGYEIGSRNSASVTVRDNDIPTVSISGGSAITEGGTATFSLSATPRPTSSITVRVNVQSGSFAQSGQRNVVIGTGGTGSFTVRTINDSTDEPNGFITANILSSGQTYSVSSSYSASVRVNDNDDPQVPVVSISGGSAITEGGTATFSLNATPKPTSSITVRVNVQSGSFAQSGQRNVVIGTGGTGSFTVTTINDSTDEPNGSVTATLVSGTGYEIGSQNSASVTVRDNDIPTVSISGSSAITEGGTATFSLNATPRPASSITVRVNVQSGSFAQSGQRNVVIGTGGTGSLTVTTVNDSTDEPNGSITATLTSGTGYSVGSPSSASVTVNDNDGSQVPVVNISGSSAITEGGTATFSLSATPRPASSITVRVSVQSGSFAQSGQRNVVIGTGGTGSFTVTTINDSTDEPNGSVTATLTSGTGYNIGSRDSAAVTVTDDDDSQVPMVSISGSSAVMEGDTATFSLSTTPKPASSITVRVSVQSGSFAESGQQSVVIGTGGTGSFAVPTEDDSMDEPDDSITATLVSGTGYRTGPSNSASVTVMDNDDNDDSPLLNDELSLEDRRILVAIYNVAGGGRWTRQNNWVTEAPFTVWYGVIADMEGRVTGLRLEDNNLEGGIHGDIEGLDKLKVLYMNNNKLKGPVPVAQLGALESLEELALWGNKGLTGTIPDELGKRVDRAALRAIKEVNGGSLLAGWFTQDDRLFDYSGWSWVEINGNDRVSGLDLSGVGLRGEITEAIWELSALEELDLSDNPGLRGNVPLAVMSSGIEFLDISGTGVCVTRDEVLEQWLESIVFTDNDNCLEDKTATLSTSEPDRESESPQANEPPRISESAQGSEGGGGCSVASGSGFKRSVSGFAPPVFVLLIIFLAWRSRNNNGRCPLK